MPGFLCAVFYYGSGGTAHKKGGVNDLEKLWSKFGLSSSGQMLRF
jgi:hypothetical protein